MRLCLFRIERGTTNAAWSTEKGFRKLAKGIEGTFLRKSGASGLVIDTWPGIKEILLFEFDMEGEMEALDMVSEMSEMSWDGNM